MSQRNNSSSTAHRYQRTDDASSAVVRGDALK
jgi:hypothetical protein